MKKLWGFLLAAGLALAPALAMGQTKFKLQDSDLQQQTTYYFGSTASSTNAIKGYAYGFAAYSVGADLKFTIQQTTKTTDTAVHVDTSAAITIPAGVMFNHNFGAVVKDLKLITHGFDTAATNYFWIQYGQVKTQE